MRRSRRRWRDGLGDNDRDDNDEGDEREHSFSNKYLFQSLAVKSSPSISRSSSVFPPTFGWVLNAQGETWTPIQGLPGPQALPPGIIVIHAGVWWSYFCPLMGRKI